MSVAVAVPETNALELSTAINDAHHRVLESATNMVHYAVEAGRLLIEAKANVSAGHWVAWVEANFQGGEWVARKYMQLAREENTQIGSVTSHPSIRAALKAIATPNPRKQIEVERADPDSPIGRLVAGAKATLHPEPSDFIEADIVDAAPSGIPERRWNTALRRWDDVRRCMNEAVRTELTANATAQALQEASIAARQAAVELEQMASSARRRSLP